MMNYEKEKERREVSVLSNSAFVFDEKRVKELPMVDIAYEILKQSKKNYMFKDLLHEIANIKGVSKEEVVDKMAQLFTEVNIDGRFVHLGQNEWGLKNWFPFDQRDTLYLLKDDEDDDEDYDEDEDDFKEEDDEDFDDDEDDDEDDEDFDEDFDEDEDDDEELFEDEDLDDSEDFEDEEADEDSSDDEED